MNKNLVSIAIVALLICLVMSGCTKSFLEKDKSSIPTVIEAVVQVVNNTGQPVANASVTFEFEVNGKIQSTLVRTTDSTGWTPFAVADLKNPPGGHVGCNMYLTSKYTQMYYHRLQYMDIEDRLVNGVYYWSLSEIIVQG